MIPTKNEYFEKPQSQVGMRIEYAKVMAFSDRGEPLLRFSGETITSPKVYARMRHYNDSQIGDRVLVINDIIVGTWTL